MNKYDYLVVGCGMFGSVFAQQMTARNKKVMVIEKRHHIGGNCYTEPVEGINVHKYGPHIFHTSNRKVWDYVNRFTSFNSFVNRPKVFYKGKLYSFPVNLMTFYQLWNVKTPSEAKRRLKQDLINIDKPLNLEQWALANVGTEIYEIFIKGYTKKQWGRDPNELPSDIIKRIPIRFNFDDNYYDDTFQGIPVGGYTRFFERLLKGTEYMLNTDYLADKNHWNGLTKKVVYTGKIDEFFDYRLGQLEYRSLRFETKVIDNTFQGNAVINYTDESVEYTRVIEHKFFEYNNQPKTIVSWEYPDNFSLDKVPYYPVNDHRNNNLYQQYHHLAENQKNFIFGGRLASYSYLDMDDTILNALKIAEKEG